MFSKKVMGLLFGTTLLASSALANTFIMFDVPSTFATGNYKYAGGAAPLVGKNILISGITGVNTNFNAGTIACVGCLLQFTTGLNTTFTPSGAGAPSWTFDSAGATAFTITGKVPTLGINTTTVLASGGFVGGPITLTHNSGQFFTLTSNIYDSKNTKILDYFMGPAFTATSGTSYAGTYSQSFTVKVSAINKKTGAFSTLDMYQGEVSNVVPEPGETLLLTTAFGALAFFFIRRKRQAAATANN